MKLTWQDIVFMVLNIVTMNGNSRYFTRSQVLSHIDTAEKLSAIFGHKNFPEKLKQTIQKTMQIMRDKGFIVFKAAYSGVYSLTDTGCDEMNGLLKSLKGE